MKAKFIILYAGMILSMSVSAGGHRVVCGDEEKPNLICKDKNGLFIYTEQGASIDLIKLNFVDASIYTNENRDFFVQEKGTAFYLVEDNKRVKLECRDPELLRCPLSF